MEGCLRQSCVQGIVTSSASFEFAKAETHAYMQHIGFLRTTNQNVLNFNESCAERYGHLVEELALGRSPDLRNWRWGRRFADPLAKIDMTFQRMAKELDVLESEGSYDPRPLIEVEILSACPQLRTLAFEALLSESQTTQLDRIMDMAALPFDLRPFQAISTTLHEFRLTSNSLNSSRAVLQALAGESSALVKLTIEHRPTEEEGQVDRASLTGAFLRSIVAFTKLRILVLICPSFFHYEIDYSNFANAVKCHGLERFVLRSRPEGGATLENRFRILPFPREAMRFAGHFGRNLKYITLDWHHCYWGNVVMERSNSKLIGLFPQCQVLELDAPSILKLRWHHFIQPKKVILKRCETEEHFQELLTVLSELEFRQTAQDSVFSKARELEIAEEAWIDCLLRNGFEETVKQNQLVGRSCRVGKIRFKNNLESLLDRRPELLVGDREEVLEAMAAADKKRQALLRRAFHDNDLD